jgi:hypothetical protein
MAFSAVLIETQHFLTELQRTWWNFKNFNKKQQRMQAKKGRKLKV